MDELYRHLLNGNPRRASGIGAEETMDALTAMAGFNPELTYCGGAKCQILSTGSEIVAAARDVNVLIETPAE
jgi:hypothetical protein